MKRRRPNAKPRKQPSEALRRLESIGASSPRSHAPPPPRRKPKKKSRRRQARAPRSSRLGNGFRAIRGFFRFSLGFLLIVGTIGVVGAAGVGVYYYQRVATQLPDVTELRNYKPSLVTRVFDHTGSLVREFYVERRFLIKLEEMPDVILQAVLATEDARFEEHPGIDVLGIVRAALRNVIGGGVVQGGSTITQQLAKRLFLTPRRSLDRKIREAILAVRIEQTFSKREILSLYLNQIYFGHGAYGIEAASRVYFGKSARDATLAEAALLAGLPRAPSLNTPFKSYKRALRRRAHVLRRMVEEGYITPDEWAQAEEEPIRLTKPPIAEDEAGYAIEYVRRRIESLFGSSRLYRGGLRVYTTIEPEIQNQANLAVRQGILAVDRRRGYRGPIGSVDLRWSDKKIWRMVSRKLGDRSQMREIRKGRWIPAVVFKVNQELAELRTEEGAAILSLKHAAWARPFDPRRSGLGQRLQNLRKILRRGDVILVRPLVSRKHLAKGTSQGAIPVALVQEPDVQAAAVVTDPKTGAIRAMVGGYDIGRSKFNRAYQAIRPPGSAFKPVTYSTAISEGWTPSDIVMDAPIVFPNPATGGYWKPTNFEKRFYGPTTIREALAQSRNVVTVKVANSLGMTKVLRRARALGIRSPLRKNLSVALGSSGVSLLELTSLYGGLANQGRHVEPHILTRVESPDGKVIWRATPKVNQAVPPEEAYLLISLLKNVVEWGTAKKAKSLNRPIAGKTGTTNDFEDAWFVGATPLYATGVWVGMDDKTTLGRSETGSRAALPIWMNIVRGIHKALPPVDFERPPKIAMTSINPRTGVQVPPDTPGSVIQAFISGTEPSSVAKFPLGQQGVAIRSGDDSITNSRSGTGASGWPASGEGGRSSSSNPILPSPPEPPPSLDPFRAGSAGP